MKPQGICLSLPHLFHWTQYPPGPSRLSQWQAVILFYDQVIFQCTPVPQLLCPVVYCWALGLLSYPGCLKTILSLTWLCNQVWKLCSRATSLKSLSLDCMRTNWGFYKWYCFLSTILSWVKKPQDQLLTIRLPLPAVSTLKLCYYT